MSQRITLIAGVTAAAALLAACGTTNPTQPVATYPSQPVYTSQPAPAVQQTAPATREFGRVTNIESVAQGQTSATNPSARNAVVGGIIGAVVGNVVGKNVNDGHNRTGATVLGAAGGAAIGNRVGNAQEQRAAAAQAANPAYRVTVQTDQGQWRTFEVGALGDLRVGDRVRVENGVIYRG